MITKFSRTLLSVLIGSLLLVSTLISNTQGTIAQSPTETSQAGTPESTPDSTPDTALESTPQGESNSVTGSATITKTLPFDVGFLERLTLPEGFEINIFAQGLGNTRWMAFTPDGTLLVTRRNEGDVIALMDTNTDGIADENAFKVIASNLPYVHGITIHNGQLYLATDTSVYTAPVFAEGEIGTLTPLIVDLPTGGQHPNRTIAFGPDEMMYISIGSTCNACAETDPENATIVRARANGTSREVFAKGLRNSMGFGWHPTTKEMWAFDHGSDWRGDDQPPEELNKIEETKNYGWPWCFGMQQPDIYLASPPPANLGRATYCQQTAPPTLEYTAHSAPIGFVFYTGSQFPAEYTNDVFVAMRGSWNRGEPSGYKVVRVLFDDVNGQPTEIQDFLTGFLIEDQLANFGRVAGLVVAPDGSLFLSEDTNGVIYRISYTG